MKRPEALPTDRPGATAVTLPLLAACLLRSRFPPGSAGQPVPTPSKEAIISVVSL